MVPGVPLTYASSALLDGFANGVLVTTVNGRPIKIEGNEQHPWSRGGTDVFAQASVFSSMIPTARRRCATSAGSATGRPSPAC